ncbi:hypothetical protein OG840_19540 [Streptomyces sp. NBC_01764]|nr:MULTISPECIES: hypothetical protein [unclassified Streptomyces]MCX4403899.1 hypothetical protein [Streptomyces sp. NBC_01764]
MAASGWVLPPGASASQAISHAEILTDRRALGGAYWKASVVLRRAGRARP